MLCPARPEGRPAKGTVRVGRNHHVPQKTSARLFTISPPAVCATPSTSLSSFVACVCLSSLGHLFCVFYFLIIPVFHTLSPVEDGGFIGPAVMVLGTPPTVYPHALISPICDPQPCSASHHSLGIRLSFCPLALCVLCVLTSSCSNFPGLRAQLNSPHRISSKTSSTNHY